MINIFGRQYLFRKKHLAVIHGIIDAIGYFLFRGRRGNPAPKDAKSILVARCDHLGDVFIASSILPHLKKAFPKARVDFLAGSWAGPLLNSNPHISRHLVHDSLKLNRGGKSFFSKAAVAFSCFTKNVLELRKARYDVCVDLRAFSSNSVPLLFLGGCKYRAGFATGGWGFLLTRIIPYKEGGHEITHIADALTALGVKVKETGLSPVFTLNTTDEKTAVALLKSIGVSEGERFVLIHTGSGLPAKRWKTQRWQELADKISARWGLKVVAFDDSSSGLKGCNKLPALLELSAFAAVAKRAALFAGLDSFPSHVSASLGTPTVVVWCGVNDPAKWRPLGSAVAIVRKDVPCSPCNLKDGCASMTCMDISADDCLKEIEKLFKKPSAGNIIKTEN